MNTESSDANTDVHNYLLFVEAICIMFTFPQFLSRIVAKIRGCEDSSELRQKNTLSINYNLLIQ